MEREMFDKLPYNKQLELERLYFRNILFGFTLRESPQSDYVTLAVRPMFKAPVGENEYRYYNETSDQVIANGKHLFSELVFKGSISDWGGSYAWDVGYSDVHRVDQRLAKLMYNTLKWLDRKMREVAEWSFDTGVYSSYAEFITTAARAMCVVGGLLFDESSRTYRQISLSELLEHIAETEEHYVNKLTAKDEPEDEGLEAVDA